MCSSFVNALQSRALKVIHYVKRRVAVAQRQSVDNSVVSRDELDESSQFYRALFDEV